MDSRRLLAAVSFALTMVLLLLLIQSLSAWMTRMQLQQDAAHTLATLRNGQPLWQWPLRQPGDLIASRAFGQATVARDGDQLRVTSLDGSPYDLGLPLSQAVDIVHWPLLRLHAQSDANGILGLIWQSEDQATCLKVDAATLSKGANEVTLDLRQLHGQTTTGSACPPPGIATLLRLHPHLPAGSSLRLNKAELLADIAPALPDTSSAAASLTLSSDLATAQSQIAQWSKQANPPAVPWIRLPADAHAETLLALRDQLRPHWPAALIVPAGATLTAKARVALPIWTSWALCSAYLLLLTWFALRPSAAWPARPWVDLALVLTGPLWLIGGLQWGLHLSIPGVIAFAAALLYAMQAELRLRPWSWQWLGHHWGDWLWPLALVPMAIGLWLLFGHDAVHPGLRHAMTYVGWACLQQWLMLAVVSRRLEQLRWPRAAQVVVIASLFALLHTPNGMLMQLCLLAELWWAWCFLRSRCLLPIAMAHASCALIVESGLTGDLLRSLEISARFFL
ncbi:CPBP family intramembrane glutamic endopeptidase [Dyella tabacisoli]|uniref:CPBP family intramembrane metalloprotease n=1 Tax=Dyella tabacisoli TaxID=2282381 RepID=A0A369UXS7_9GAMM|nr:CPBP family intramembrane glutamic endopeptidase [Dyella tabacisoli]RDD83149.1 CPBP family intramembrane metalloprotease [Dyella tabacisoli]